MLLSAFLFQIYVTVLIKVFYVADSCNLNAQWISFYNHHCICNRRTCNRTKKREINNKLEREKKERERETLSENVLPFCIQ